MARDVNDALIAVVRDHGKVDAVAATTTVAGWMQEKRYVRDVWA